MDKPNLSFVIPAKNEESSLEILYQEIIENVNKLHQSFEIIFIDDGSDDQTFRIMEKLHQKDNRVKAISLRGNFGKSKALQTGFNHASGKIIFTMDADLQDNPIEISRFLEKIDEGYDMISGWKRQRHDPSLAKVIPSRIINCLVRSFTGVKIHDTNCGFKAYREEVVKHLNLYGELYRYIPVIAAKQNFKVGEIIVEHRARQYGKTKYNWKRGIKGLLDLLTIIFLTGYINRPGHFFGTLGLSTFFIGFLIGLYIAYLRFATGSIQFRHPLLFLGMLLMIIGVQLISTGLLAETIIYSKPKDDDQLIIRKSFT